MCFLGHARKVVREAGEIFLINTSRLQILRWSWLSCVSPVSKAIVCISVFEVMYSSGGWQQMQDGPVVWNVQFCSFIWNVCT